MYNMNMYKYMYSYMKMLYILNDTKRCRTALTSVLISDRIGPLKIRYMHKDCILCSHG